MASESSHVSSALDGKTLLQAALWDLSQMLEIWVTPRLAVGPSARQGLTMTPSATEEARRRIESLPALPSDWQPSDAGQRIRFRRLRGPIAS